MKTYAKPVIDIEIYETEDKIMTSEIGLTNGGMGGKSVTESFSSLFGDK
ncbi:MAG: hypothetical protein IJ736_12815 [Firmicutes bacterium]|nr:hypothetical protein [Bacillota bacterium]